MKSGKDASRLYKIHAQLFLLQILFLANASCKTRTYKTEELWENSCVSVFEGLKLGKNIPDFYELITAPVMKVGRDNKF